MMGMGMGMPVAKQGLPQHVPAPARPAAAGGAADRARRPAGRSAASPSRSSAPRSWATRRTSSSRASSAHQLPSGVTQARSRPGCAPPARTSSPTCSRGMTVMPGVRHRFRGAGEHPARARRPVHPQLRLRLGPGLHHGRRDPAHRLPAAPGGRPEARPAAAQLLRRATPAATCSAASPTTSTTSARRSSRA